MTNSLLRGQLADAFDGLEPFTTDEQEAAFDSWGRRQPLYREELTRTGREPDLRAPGAPYRRLWQARLAGTGNGAPIDSPPSAYSREDLKREVTHFEGRRDIAYPDSMGKPTIGVGHLIGPAEYAKYGVLLNPVGSEAKKQFSFASHQPLKAEQIDSYLDHDIDEAERTLDRLELPWRSLDPVRQRLLVNMAFQLGQTNLGKFTRTMELVRTGAPPAEVAKEMLKSKWATMDTPDRATWLANAYATGAPAPLPVLGRSGKTPWGAFSDFRPYNRTHE